MTATANQALRRTATAVAELGVVRPLRATPMNRKTNVMLGLAVLAPLLYIASIGPVAYAHIRLGWFSEGALDAVYAPLRLIPNTRVTAALMKSYIELWLGPGDCGGTGPGG